MPAEKEAKQPGQIGPAYFKLKSMQIFETIETAVNNPALNGRINAAIWSLNITGIILKDLEVNQILTGVSLITATAASLTTVLVQLKNLFNNKKK